MRKLTWVRHSGLLPVLLYWFNRMIFPVLRHWWLRVQGLGGVAWANNQLPGRVVGQKVGVASRHHWSRWLPACSWSIWSTSTLHLFSCQISNPLGVLFAPSLGIFDQLYKFIIVFLEPSFKDFVTHCKFSIILGPLSIKFFYFLLEITHFQKVIVHQAEIFISALTHVFKFLLNSCKPKIDLHKAWAMFRLNSFFYSIQVL